MAKGKKTGGRQKGTPNKATVERDLRAAQGLKAATLDGLLPLDVMMCRMRNRPLPNGSMVDRRSTGRGRSRRSVHTSEVGGGRVQRRGCRRRCYQTVA